MELFTATATFTASTTSATVTPQVKGPVVALQTPAAFGATTIKFTFCETENGTYLPVKNDTGADITVTVSATDAGLYDITNIFPLSVGKMAGNNKGYFKLVAGTSTTAAVKVYFLGE